MDIDKEKWQQLWQEVVEKKKMDPVDDDELKGKHSDRKDKDIDNDGDVDSTDKYLHNRRKTIKKAMAKEAEMKVCPECGGSMDNHNEECSKYNKEAADLDASSAKSAVKHDCATHVASEQWGYGECIPGEHTIVETAEGEGYVTHYDIMFEHGVEFNVPVEDLTILSEKSHMHAQKMTPKQKQKAQKSASQNKSFDSARSRLAKEEVSESVTVAEMEQEIEQTYSELQSRAIEAMRSMWAESYAQHTKGATKPEGMHDKESPKSKEFIDQHKKSEKSIEDKEEQGHDDVSKAGRAVKSQAPKRGSEPRIGDMTAEKPVDTTKAGKGGA